MTAASEVNVLYGKGFGSIMKVYRVSGTFPQGRIEKMKFSKDVIAKDPAVAKEQLLSLMGSKHRVKRRFIKIKSVTEIDPKDSKDASIRAIVEE
jgi:large subunit ribosomal protein LX